MRKPIHFTRQSDNEGGPLGKGLHICCWLAFSLSFSPLFAQPCPSIVNCPQSTLTYCDESLNDINFWNQAPFTHSPTTGDANLHEGAIDLNIRLKGCNGGGLGTISFVLYLDLDNDDIQETVVTSGNPPPPGMVMANNSFNPGYSGGDTVLFDQRGLPDSMLYRFALEIAYSGDTTIGWIRFNTNAAPYDFVPVILPEGRHRIEWRGVQDSVERYCNRNFKVKDCKKPTVICKPGLAVYLDLSQNAMLTLPEALNMVSDNVTPDTQLVLGMRRVGTGFGFPMDSMGNPQDTVMFNCEDSDNQQIELWAMDKAGNLENCSAAVLVYDTAGICPFVPFPSICARTYWNDFIIRDVGFNISWTIPNQPPIVNPIEVNPDGCSSLSSLPPTSLFTLSAAKDTIPLNGVTTYDLVLISKHILGIEPFDAGWKIVAADANLSHSVTTFDIVEIRKLILGITTQFPNNTPSWRFFVDTCTVWGSPFFGSCPSAYTLPVQPISFYPPNLSFSGVKIGDVNGTASSMDTLQGVAQSRGGTVLLEIPDRVLQAGETAEIPLRASEGGAWEGFQFSLKFDPKVLEIEELVPNGAITLNAENWAKPEAGLLNLSWSDALPTAVLPGDELFRLRVKALSEARVSEIIKMTNDARLESEAYDEAGVDHPLQLVFLQNTNHGEKGKTQIFPPMPNPTNGASRIPLRLNSQENVSLELRDLSGKLLWRDATALEAGAHFLEIPAMTATQSGVYFWRVCAGNVVGSGRLVRL